jgi:uncharacterized protein (DUF1015 family)
MLRPMAYIAPFRALRYDSQRLAIELAVTQPYDKITPQMQDAYYAASPHNLVRIILGKRDESDDSKENVYSRAAGYFRDWRREGIFQQDSEPSLYSYLQQFEVPGTSEIVERRGFIALGRLEDYGNGIVFRHEETLAKPKADRLDLLRATRAHFGQLFMLYEDNGEIESLLASNGPPTIQVADEYNVQHQVWKVSEASVIDLVRRKMRDKKLIIADGHHRYETALNYRNERRATHPAGVLPRERASAGAMAGQEELAPYDLVMMTFVNMNNPGLLVLPTHRVVHGVDGFSSERVRTEVARYFSVEEVDPAVDARRATAILRQAGKAGTALLAITRDGSFLLHTPKNSGSPVFQGYSLRQQSLDVVQLHRGVLEGALGISEAAVRDQLNVRYVRDADEAIQQVRRGEADVTFLMNPVGMEQVRDIAFGGEVLPQKSTDFYPKLLSGLTVYALE